MYNCNPRNCSATADDKNPGLALWVIIDPLLRPPALSHQFSHQGKTWLSVGAIFRLAVAGWGEEVGSIILAARKPAHAFCTSLVTCQSSLEFTAIAVARYTDFWKLSQCPSTLPGH